MNVYLSKFLLLLVLATSVSCSQQDREETQHQFRERQRAIEERQGQQPSEPTANPTELPTTTKPPVTAEQPAAIPAGDKVIAVKDGDTIELLRNGEKIKVRLYGVDAPEKAQDYGQRAKQFASDLVFGKYVKLIPHNKDRYGRTVGTIILADGRSLNEELVRNGYAWHYKAYSKDKNLANLEADARRFKRGLWQSANPTPPWDYRKNKRTGKQQVSIKKAPPGSENRMVYFCNSSGSVVYHHDKSCAVLKRCKAEILAVTEAKAIKQYSRRADKTCGN